MLPRPFRVHRGLGGRHAFLSTGDDVGRPLFFFISHAPSGRSTHAVTPGVASASVRLPRAAETTEEPAARGGQERGAYGSLERKEGKKPQKTWTPETLVYIDRPCQAALRYSSSCKGHGIPSRHNDIIVCGQCDVIRGRLRQCPEAVPCISVFVENSVWIKKRSTCRHN